MSQTLKSRIAAIVLMALLLTSFVGTICCAAEVNAQETEKSVVEVKLNRKVFFEGKTYWNKKGKGSARKTYTDGKIGCGIIGGIDNNKPYGVYIIGEGFIAKDQIKSTEKYISLKFDKMENGLKSQLNINGEFVNVDSGNTGIIKYENGVLKAGANGTTTVKITTKEGKEIEALATVYKGNIELNIPEKSVSLEGDITADLADKKVNVSADGAATAALVVTEEGIGIGATGEANAKLDYKETEILDVNASASGIATATKDGLEVEATASQKATLFNKLSAKLSERATASIDKERAEASAGGDVEVNDKKVGSADVGAGYEYATDTGTASISASVLENEVINKQKDFKPVQALKSLLSKLIRR